MAKRKRWPESIASLTGWVAVVLAGISPDVLLQHPEGISSCVLSGVQVTAGIWVCSSVGKAHVDMAVMDLMVTSRSVLKIP